MLTLQERLRSGELLGELRGAALDARVPVRQELLRRAIEDWLQAAPRPVQRLEVEIREGNLLWVTAEARVLIFPVRLRQGFVVEEIRMAPSPKVFVRFASKGFSTLMQLVGMLGKTYRLLPAVLRIGDGFMEVDLGAVPAVAAQRHWWRHVEAVRVRTEPGLLWLELRVVVR